LLNPFLRLLKSIRYLGFKKTTLFAVYLIAKKVGYYRFFNPALPPLPQDFTPPAWINSFFPAKTDLLAQLSQQQIKEILQKADEVTTGKTLAFGWYLMPIDFSGPPSPLHWSKLSDNYTNGEDIKLHWEIARFSWVFPLIQAFRLTGDERYFLTFKQYFQQFSSQNPANMGLQWESAQEVSLRLVALLCAYIVFKENPAWDTGFETELYSSIWQHTWRIPPTLNYARSQNNNHLLSEALALFYAGAFFQNLPAGRKIQAQGWQIFNQAIQQQIQPNGTYVQQSMNYHRLMLTEAVWFTKLATQLQLQIPQKTLSRLQAATFWLEQFTQVENGHVPNLGHNDGSFVFPLSPAPYDDYRPTLDSCRCAFFHDANSSSTEYAIWLGLTTGKPINATSSDNITGLPMIKGKKIQIYLRAEQFTDRPTHADQLHTDIWFCGENIAQDAGTYRYTDKQPWNNGLAHTLNHNTLTINGQDQMTWAGRFLWLDWSKGSYLSPTINPLHIAAQHDGYKKSGVLHQREVISDGISECHVIDQLIPTRKNAAIQDLLLHWLLPDGEWKIVNQALLLTTSHTQLALSVSQITDHESCLLPMTIVRCGQILHGTLLQSSATLGWISPTYNVKLPALSILVQREKPDLPITLQSNWKMNTIF
jgi:hypothetical protein